MKSLYKKIALLAIVLSAFVLLPVYTSAQSIKENKADKYFESYAYSKAVEIYEDLFANDSKNVKYIQRLAYSYDKMLNYKKALKYYSQLVQLEQAQAADYYEYAQLLRIDGKDVESKLWLEKYMIKSPGDQRVKSQLENFSKKAKTGVENVSVRNLEGNTRFTDMSANYFKDQLVYSSAKDSFSMVKNTYDWNNQPFLDLYITNSGSGLGDEDSKSVFSSVNTRFHEGSVSFTSDLKTMYFTRNNFLNGRIMTMPDGTNNLKILIADFNGKEWKNIRSFPFNSDRYSVGHPALSADDKTLYFISDKPGGYGQTDIYKSEWDGSAWGNPVNLGESVNTSGREMFTYIDKEGVLYFSSDGHPGNGGLDIFAAKPDKSGNYKVVNVVSPINSPYDDFSLVINNDSLTGYFTSNRTEGKGDDDIYSFIINTIDLRILVYDDRSKALLPGSRVSLMTDKTKLIDTKIADLNGAVEFSVKPKTKYQVIAENTTYTPETKDIQIKGSLFDFMQQEDIYLKQAYAYLTIEVIDKESGLIIPKALVYISEGKYDESELEDNNGIIKMRLNESTDYTFYATAEEYFDNTSKFSSVGKGPGEYSMTIELEKLSAGKQFTLDDLYYDLDKYNIRPDAAIVLDKLANILIDNPEVRIEIGSHTDSRATAVYNMKLSQNRSESVVVYLISKGIAKSRLVAKGYGETQLINKCADGVDCPEVDHQANRRTVIEILNQDIRRVKRGSKNVYYF